MWQLVIDSPHPSVVAPLQGNDVAMEGDINCHIEEEDTAAQPISVSTQVTLEISQDKESEFNEKFNIIFPTIKGQCLNTKDFKLVKDSLIAEIENSLNPNKVINSFLDSYANIMNSSQKKQLAKIINSG
ncbi:hypothetical protein [Pleurocapsa sp. PCC 7319]|uniref:hypothetical protein n=1 Tax=Pleurocapsa sp. PCC 7319 TaxID=118161 RepID=UPI000346D7B3|nr:hypothetical protein [Pleurocapsa sp. PCC 7319]